MKRVLIADDNPAMVELIKARLRALDYTDIDVARDGVAARRMLDEKKYSLIIMDQIMPGMTGLEVLRDLKFAVPPVDAPVMMITAAPDQSMMETINREALQVSAIIAKPFSSVTFHEKHKQLLPRIRDVENVVNTRDSKIEDSHPKQYNGTAMKMRIVLDDKFFGISIQGSASVQDRFLIKKGFDAAVLAKAKNIVINIAEVESMDEFFIGFFLLFAGTIASSSRTLYLIIGENKKSIDYGFDRIATCFKANQEFYQEIGYEGRSETGDEAAEG